MPDTARWVCTGLLACLVDLDQIQRLTFKVIVAIFILAFPKGRGPTGQAVLLGLVDCGLDRFTMQSAFAALAASLFVMKTINLIDRYGLALVVVWGFTWGASAALPNPIAK